MVRVKPMANWLDEIGSAGDDVEGCFETKDGAWAVA